MLVNVYEQKSQEHFQDERAFLLSFWGVRGNEENEFALKIYNRRLNQWFSLITHLYIIHISRLFHPRHHQKALVKCPSLHGTRWTWSYSVYSGPYGPQREVDSCGPRETRHLVCQNINLPVTSSAFSSGLVPSGDLSALCQSEAAVSKQVAHFPQQLLIQPEG